MNFSAARRLLKRIWIRFWIRYVGPSRFGKIASHLVAQFAPPYKGQCRLAELNPQGYIAPSAAVRHQSLQRNHNVYIGERVVIFQVKDGGAVILEEGVHLYGDTIIETGDGGSVTIGANTHIQARCHFAAYKRSIKIGRQVDIAPNCAFFSYNHSFAYDHPIREQPLQSKGDIIIEDNAWLGVNVTVLDGVRIGEGSVIGAGSIVTHDIPDFAIAVGSPARVVKMRHDVPPAPIEP